jgi:type IV pilus assembly protein PilE
VNQSRHIGMTLIELMIVVVVVAILAGIAMPSYQDSVRRSRQSDGQEALMRASQSFEVFFARQATYPAVDSDGDGDFLDEANVSSTSDEGYYTLALDAATADCPIQSCYSITVTPTAKGGQNLDSVKGFRFRSSGEKEKSLDGSTYTTGWGKH